MKKQVLTLYTCCLLFTLNAQEFTITGATKKQDYYVSKVTFGRAVDYQQEFVFEMKNTNGDLYYAALVYAYESFAKGSSHEVTLKSSGPEISPASQMRKLGSTAIPEAADRFHADFSTAFIGDNNQFYSTAAGPIKGSAKVGDKFTCTDEDKKTHEITVTAIRLNTPGGEVNLKAVDERFKIGDGFSLDFVFTTTTGKGPGGKFSFSPRNSTVAGTAPANAPATFSGKREVMPKNVVLTDGSIHITLNNLVKYEPKQADSPILKIDESLDYYILDVTLSNTTKKTIDAGEYLIHLNLYDAAGVNSDDHGSLFKNTGGDAKKEVAAIDKEVLGGTSAIRYAGVLTLYSSQDPSYSQQQYDAAWGKLKMGEQVTCTSVKVIGVPKTFKPTEIGFWLTDSRKTVKAKL
jgi:hypothetical protein